MNDEFILLLDHIQAAMQDDNEKLREDYRAKQKICLEYIKRLKQYNQLLKQIKALHVSGKRYNKIIIKAIHGMFKVLHQDHEILKRDHSLLSELSNIWLMKSGNSDKNLEHIINEMRTQKHLNVNLEIPKSTTTNIHAGDQTQQLNVTSIGGDNKKS